MPFFNEFTKLKVKDIVLKQNSPHVTNEGGLRSLNMWLMSEPQFQGSHYPLRCNNF